MVLVGHKDHRHPVDKPGDHAPVHGVADHAVKMVLPDQPVDIQRGPHHVGHDPFRVPEGLFEAEETPLPFETDLTGGTVQVRAPVLAHEIMGFPVPCKVDFMPVLLEVVPEVEGPRGMAEPFPADNKKEFHNRPASMVCSLLPYPKAVLPLSVRYGCLCRGFSGGIPE